MEHSTVPGLGWFLRNISCCNYSSNNYLYSKCKIKIHVTNITNVEHHVPTKAKNLGLRELLKTVVLKPKGE